MKIPVASHTMLAAFENCPHKGFRMYISKDLPREQTPEMQRGKDVHTALQKRITTGRELPPDMVHWERLVEPIAAWKPAPFAELPLAIRRVAHPQGYEIVEPCGFFDKDVQCRGYADVVAFNRAERPTIAILFDWKTGKKREDPAELKLHALMLQARYKSLERIIGHYVWLQEKAVGKPHDLSNTVATRATLDAQLDEIEFMATQNNFPKQPNPLCGWCPVKDCEHNKDRR